MTSLHLDLETYSSINLKDCGVYRYAESEDFEILLCAYAYDENPVTVLDLTKTELPSFLIKDLLNPGVQKIAHNAQFERICLSSYLHRHSSSLSIPYLDPESWYCTMVHSSVCGLPLQLKQVGEALELDKDKKKLDTGKSLIEFFCQPYRLKDGTITRHLAKDYPQQWQAFIEYNKRDVETEREIEKRLCAIYPMPTEELKRYHLDQRLNDRGLGIDLDLVEKVLSYGPSHNERLRQEAQNLANLNLGSPKKLKKWLEEQTGQPLESVGKESLHELIEKKNEANVQRILECRLEFSKTSCKKYDVIQAATCQDGRIRGVLQFYGSRTGRWAGRLLQPQNLPKNDFNDFDVARQLVKEENWDLLELCYPSINGVFSTLIRTTIIPPENQAFAIADYSAIEARIIAWLADEAWRIQAFHDGVDIYCASASVMFGVPVEKHGQNSHLRKKGKIAELACGFGGGVGALKRFHADKLGLSQTDMVDIISKWRKQNPNITRLWKQFEDMAKQALKGKKVKGPKGITFEMKEDNLFVRLPSGRPIIYQSFGLYEDSHKKEESLAFKGLGQKSHKWETIFTWGGKLTENIVQAIARDCLALALDRLDEAGYRPILHVHDEVIVEVPDKEKEHHLRKIEAIMGDSIPWAPSLELTAAGFTADYYQKD